MSKGSLLVNVAIRNSSVGLPSKDSSRDRTWTVSAEIELARPLRRFELDRLQTLLVDSGALRCVTGVARRHRHAKVVCELLAPESLEAHRVFEDLVRRLMSRIGLDIVDVVEIRAAQSDLRQTKNDAALELNELGGVHEAAVILQVSRQHLYRLYDHPAFPPPITRLRATPVFLGSDLRSFAAGR